MSCGTWSEKEQERTLAENKVTAKWLDVVEDDVRGGEEEEISIFSNLILKS